MQFFPNINKRLRSEEKRSPVLRGSGLRIMIEMEGDLMKQLFVILMLMFTAQMTAMPQSKSMEHGVNINSDSPKLLEVILTVSLEEIMISPEGITVDYEGQMLNVCSLERKGDFWIVRAQKWYQCPNEHTRTCTYCGGCGYIGCLYHCDGTCC